MVTLPSLANTEESDRLLLREVSDDQQFVEAIEEITTATAASGDVTLTQDTGQAIPDILDEPMTGEPVSRAAQLPSSDITGRPDAEPADAPTATGDAGRLSFTGATIDEPWQRIKSSDQLPAGEHASIDEYRDRYIDEALWIGRLLERSRPYIAYLVDELDARYLPVELALLPAIESGFQTDVHSAGRAAGLWQIVPITAREIGLEKTPWFDGRADIIASTTAAIDYLSYLSAEFNGNWELSLAAYNAGPGRVRAAMRKNREADLPTDFWSLDLPSETRAYVPKVLALANLVKSDDSPIELPTIGALDGFEVVDVGRRVSIERAAQISGVAASVLEQLNAGLTLGMTPPEGPHRLYFPPDQGLDFIEQVAASEPHTLFSPPDTHEVVAGDTLSGIAQKYGMSQKQLELINGMYDTRIRIGQNLAVQDLRRGGNTVGEIEYVVTIGDTLSGIADRHSVPMTDIHDADGQPMADALIHPGETLTIRVDLGSQG